MSAGAAGFAVHTLRRSDQRREGAATCDLRLVFVFEIASYFAWALGFANYRYAIPLEMLTGVLTVGSVMWVLRGPRTRMRRRAGVGSRLINCRGRFLESSTGSGA
jgi:hypothetical protein